MEKLMLNLTFFRGSGQTASQAHGTFVCGKNGGGVAEEINCERDVNICIGTLTKAAVCHVGFIACRRNPFIKICWWWLRKEGFQKFWQWIRTAARKFQVTLMTNEM
ncbi:hypothetical protein SLEP1_g28037 [Rubroshorea leprosula]|uniref:Uncharacterized protein n=1 Tax=Rubroshorea leprosula TaxID=152421 RepID=A0AAV5K4W0_9ROSI|nr:hypothetical protein SLEP1_g28037 [Rubroshorea leprosula]